MYIITSQVAKQYILKAATKMESMEPNYYEVTNEYDSENEYIQKNPFKIEVDQESYHKIKRRGIIIPLAVLISLQIVIILLLAAVLLTNLLVPPSCSQANSPSQGSPQDSLQNSSPCQNSSGSHSGGVASQYNCHNDINELKQIISNITETACVAVTDDQMTSNETSPLQQVHEQLTHIVSTLSNIKNTGTSTAGATNDVLDIVEELLRLQNASSILNSVAPVSCQDIKAALPNTQSGYYYVNNHYIYCNMGELCGSEGGWMRLAYLDMSDATQICPTALKLYESGGVRACGSPSGGAGCASVKFPSNGISYSQVCGRVVGYQYASPDADYPGRYEAEPYGSIIDSSHTDINSYYVDGVSITYSNPRQHVWTLMAGLFEVGAHNAGSTCPCTLGSVQNTTLQSFIGNDYFCESGNPAVSFQTILYTSDPLWDGKGCDSESVCCTAPGLPWFHKVLNTTTTDYLEMRICRDESTANEDIPVGLYEIYVK